MKLLPVFTQSQTTMHVSQYLLPLTLVTGIACLLATGSYFFILLPSQSRFAESKLAYEKIQRTFQQNRIAWNTQQTLNKVWAQMPPRKRFIGLGTAISDLAKSHNIRIPEIGYDLKNFRHKLAIQGTMSFKAGGRYEAIRKFIYELESKWPQLFIEKLTAERAKKDNEVAFSIVVSTFLKEKKDRDLPSQGAPL